MTIDLETSIATYDLRSVAYDKGSRDCQDLESVMWYLRSGT